VSCLFARADDTLVSLSVYMCVGLTVRAPGSCLCRQPKRALTLNGSISPHLNAGALVNGDLERLLLWQANGERLVTTERAAEKMNDKWRLWESKRWAWPVSEVRQPLQATWAGVVGRVDVYKNWN